MRWLRDCLGGRMVLHLRRRMPELPHRYEPELLGQGRPLRLRIPRPLTGCQPVQGRPGSPLPTKHSRLKVEPEPMLRASLSRAAARHAGVVRNLGNSLRADDPQRTKCPGARSPRAPEFRLASPSPEAMRYCANGCLLYARTATCHHEVHDERGRFLPRMIGWI
jgi:hypothetical protein